MFLRSEMNRKVIFGLQIVLSESDFSRRSFSKSEGEKRDSKSNALLLFDSKSDFFKKNGFRVKLPKDKKCEI